MDIISVIGDDKKKKEKKYRLLLLAWFSLHSLFNDRVCFRYYKSPGFLRFLPGANVDPQLFRKIMHIYPETYRRLCYCLKQPHSNGCQNEYFNYFGPEFSTRYHSYEIAVLCGVLATTQCGPYHVLAYLLNIPTSTFINYVRMFNSEMVKRKNDYIYFPLPQNQKQLYGNEEFGIMNGAVFALGIALLNT